MFLFHYPNNWEVILVFMLLEHFCIEEVDLEENDETVGWHDKSGSISVMSFCNFLNYFSVWLSMLTLFERQKLLKHIFDWETVKEKIQRISLRVGFFPLANHCSLCLRRKEFH